MYFCFAQIPVEALWAISCPIQSVQDGIEIVCLITFTEIISNDRACFGNTKRDADFGYKLMTNYKY